MSDDNSIADGFFFDVGPIGPAKRLCPKCGLQKPLTDFEKRPSERKRKRLCRQCNHEKKRQWAKKHPHRQAKGNRASSLRTKYKLSLAEYEAMNASQKGLCAICGKAETHRNCSGQVCPLAVDHDHHTKKIRELLCANCNRLLGACFDSIEILTRAIEYLRRHGR